MDNSEETKNQFGYYISDLTPKSNKTVVVVCDYCGRDYTTSKKGLAIARETFAHLNFVKDSCQNCKRLKTKETYELQGKDFSAMAKESGRKAAIGRQGKEEEISKKLKAAWKNKTKEDIDERNRKADETKIAKYGDLETAKQLMTEKRKATLVERYGADNPSNIKEFQDKRKATMIERFGYENVGQNEEIKAKIKETNEERYNGLYMNLPEIQQKTKISRAVNHKEIQEKTVQTNREKYGFDYYTQTQEFRDRYYKKRGDDGDIRIIDGKPVKEIAKEKNMSVSYLNLLYRNGIDVSGFEKNTNGLELIMEKVLRNIGVEFVQNKVICERKTDFVIGNLIIECDGLYWHSMGNKNMVKRYHQIKKKQYTECGYDSVFFRSNEIEHKQDIVESIVRNKLKLSHKIFARKCKIILNGVDKSWFDENHIMGNGSGTIVSLEYEGKAVAAMQFRLKNAKQELYEVSRFCTAKGISVVGGLSRLLKYCENLYNPKKLISYVDLRYGTGNCMEQLGFSYAGEYVSFMWTDGRKTYHRMKFPGSTGRDYGLHEIHDCGQAKYVKTYL